MALDPEAYAKLAALTSSGSIHSIDTSSSIISEDDAAGLTYRGSSSQKDGSTVTTTLHGDNRQVVKVDGEAEQSISSSFHHDEHREAAQIVLQAIHEETGVADPHSSMMFDRQLDCDALSLWAIVTSCEQQLGRSLADKDVYQVKTVRQLIDLFNKNQT
ncbi:MAG: hypothetical protein Q4P66_04705 [Actinomycetaceae bacterium]|nr:hypothetical protein [Actinomycetaceae bacterium]